MASKQYRMTPSRRHELRKKSLIRQMGRVAKIHSAAVASVDENDRLPFPGGSSEGRIYLNPAQLPAPDTKDGVATWIGVTMHEVGHCVWSPEADRFPSAHRHLYNVMEDARQEAMLLESLPGTKASLTRAVADLILVNPKTGMAPTGLAASQVWPLIAGRMYLPDEMRDAVYQATIAEKGKKWADAVTVVIADYMKLVDPGMGQFDDALLYMERLAELIGADEAPPTQCGHEGNDNPEVARPVMVPAPPEDDGESPEDKPDEPGQSPDSGDTDDTDESDESESGGADGDGDEDGADGDGGTSDTESGDEGDGDAEGEKGESDGGDGGSGAGTGESESVNRAAMQAKAEWEEARKAVEEASNDAKESMDSLIEIIMDKVRDDEFAAVDVSQRNSYRVTPDARQAAAKLITQLKPLTDLAEAGNDKWTAHGRIRPDRLARGYRPDRVFDKWQTDINDAVSAEIIVACDTSGSMYEWDQHLAESVWVMRQVAAKTAANLTVISWDTRAHVVTSPLRNDVAPSIYMGGGTQAAPMLQLAAEIFGRSKMNRKWLLIMTDGSITDDTRKIEYWMGILKAGKVAVTPVGFGQASYPQVFGVPSHRIDDLLELPKTVGAMLIDLYSKNVIR